MSVEAPPRPEQADGLVRLGGLPPIRTYLRSIWQRREFAINLAGGQLRAQNFDTVLGNLWHLLNPLLLIAVYYLMFGVLLDVSRGTPNFIGFLSVGIFVYTFMQKSITSGAAAIISNLGLIRSLQFPRALLPVSSVLKETMAFGSTLAVMVVVIVVTELQACAVDDPPGVCSSFSIPISPDWIVFVPVFLLTLLFAQGAAFVTARLSDHIRDTTNFLPYVFRIGFYLSGVLYPVDKFVTEDWMKQVFLANPFFVYVTLVRHYTMPTYTATDLVELWVSATAWALIMFVGGTLFFRGREKKYGRG